VLEDAQLIAHKADPFRKGRSAYYISEPLIAFYEAVMRREWTRWNAATRPERGATPRQRSSLRLWARISSPCAANGRPGSPRGTELVGLDTLYA
jgi:hypothetical protein